MLGPRHVAARGPASYCTGQAVVYRINVWRVVDCRVMGRHDGPAVSQPLIRGMSATCFRHAKLLQELGTRSAP